MKNVNVEALRIILRYCASMALHYNDEMKHFETDNLMEVLHDHGYRNAEESAAIRKVIDNAVKTNGESLKGDLENIQNEQGKSGFLGSCFHYAAIITEED